MFATLRNKCCRYLCCRKMEAGGTPVGEKRCIKDISPDTETSDDDETKRRIRARNQGRRSSVSSGSLSTKEPASGKKIVPKSAATIERIKCAVACNFMLNSLGSEELMDVIHAMEERKVQAGDTIIKQGDEGDYFYVIDNGEFDVYKSSTPGVPVFHYSNEGTFGELALMYNSPRAATVVAVSSGALWALDRDTFRRIVVTANKSRSEQNEKFLSGMDLMANLTPSEVSTIADALQPVTFRAGDVIIEQGDANYASFHFYILIQGTCAFVLTHGETGDRTPIGNVEAVGYFGEKALTEKSKRAVSVIATSDVVHCLSMDVATFERLMGPFHDVFHRKIHSYVDPTNVVGATNRV
ncbi:hypothetical protein H310_04170 [Aphanomyces invadans]|uniref:cAMP-dependent protein kinase regulatory subunit n=1 Tax=Aphanomyces invadans TaxID=157072 RepID=A0A024UHR7_9STRA|nr:hypothetical protein H310_04170 [Aphanomyces invadans]ETW05168.1 hypothetical protein H310_04170 [Aphanomyces invadans]|eukprot:XP_008866606.1 hypothetical protein H310_04170 [Aphanomyces invadans]